MPRSVHRPTRLLLPRPMPANPGLARWLQILPGSELRPVAAHFWPLQPVRTSLRRSRLLDLRRWSSAWCRRLLRRCCNNSRCDDSRCTDSHAARDANAKCSARRCDTCSSSTTGAATRIGRNLRGRSSRRSSLAAQNPRRQTAAYRPASAAISINWHPFAADDPAADRRGQTTSRSGQTARLRSRRHPQHELSTLKLQSRDQNSSPAGIGWRRSRRVRV
jgi:hypothetical protein